MSKDNFYSKSDNILNFMKLNIDRNIGNICDSIGEEYKIDFMIEKYLNEPLYRNINVFYLNLINQVVSGYEDIFKNIKNDYSKFDDYYNEYKNNIINCINSFDASMFEDIINDFMKVVSNRLNIDTTDIKQSFINDFNNYCKVFNENVMSDIISLCNDVKMDMIKAYNQQVVEEEKNNSKDEQFIEMPLMKEVKNSRAAMFDDRPINVKPKEEEIVIEKEDELLDNNYENMSDAELFDVLYEYKNDENVQTAYNVYIELKNREYENGDYNDELIHLSNEDLFNILNNLKNDKNVDKYICAFDELKNRELLSENVRK